MMGSQPMSIPNYGTASNVGHVQMHDQHNSFAPGAKELDIFSDNSQRVRQSYQNIFNFHHTSNSLPPAPSAWLDWPELLEARFAERLAYPANGYQWSALVGNFASAEEVARLTAEVDRRWRETEKSIKRLNRAVFEFQLSGCREESEASASLDDTNDTLLPEIVTEADFRDALEEAICCYRGFRKQSPVLASLRDINAHMDPFLSWLAELRDGRHRDSILFALKNIIEATNGKYPPHDDVIKTVADAVRHFRYGLGDYLSKMRAKKLTAVMETETIGIFEAIVAILVPVLKRGQGKRRSSQRETAEDSMKRLGEAVLSVKNAVKRLHTQPEEPLVDTSPDYKKAVFRFLMARPRPTSTAHAVSGALPASELALADTVPRPTRRCSMIDRDAGFIPVKAIIRYLDYDAAKKTAEIDQCIRLARPSPKDMRELDAFMRAGEYQSWLTEDSRHSALLVQGSFTAPRGRRSFSPLSYLCASFARENANRDRVVVLSYFCDLHEPGARNQAASAAGPAHLMCQLIGQLLAHPAVARVYARDPIFHRHWEKKIRAQDLKTLVKAFSALVRRLRRCELVVFCLIDAIAKLETGTGTGTHRLQELTVDVLSEIRDLVQERKRGRKRAASDRMVFKLFVSAGAVRVAAARFFDGQDTVDMAAGVGFRSRLGAPKRSSL